MLAVGGPSERKQLIHVCAGETTLLGNLAGADATDQCTPRRMAREGSIDKAYPVHERHSRTNRSRRALPITETELRLMAAAAMIGLSSTPKAA